MKYFTQKQHAIDLGRVKPSYNFSPSQVEVWNRGIARGLTIARECLRDEIPFEGWRNWTRLVSLFLERCSNGSN